MSDPALTIVVCTFNRAAKIGGVLGALRQQTILDQIEIIVVNDGSVDDTAEQLRGIDWITVITHERNRGLAAARTTGLENARAAWVAFTDDDCLPAPDWAEQLCAVAARHPDAFAVGGPVSAVRTGGLINDYLLANPPLAPLELGLLESAGFVHRLREYVRRSAAAPEDNESERAVASLPGANMAVNKERCTQLGSWDEAFVFGGEEEELFRRAGEQGLSVIYAPGPRIEHVFDNTLTDIARRNYLYGRGSERLQAKHGGLPTLYPVPVLFLGSIGLALLTRRAGWAAVAAVVPQWVFSVWPRRSWRLRRVELLAYPYLQVLQETASNVGWTVARLQRLRSGWRRSSGNE
ncbi:MAG: glycosyltransferase [Microlunatus sp.]